MSMDGGPGPGINWLISLSNRSAQKAFLPVDAELINVSTGRELLESDAGGVLLCDGTFTITAPDGFREGFQVGIINAGAGTITVAAATTLQSVGGATQVTDQWATAYLLNLGSDVWLLSGTIS